MNLNLANQTQIYLGLSEREVHPWLRRLSDKIESAIDIGAADGAYTLFFLKKTSASTIYSFEPDVKVMSWLKQNLQLNQEPGSKRLILSTQFVDRSTSNDTVCLDSLAADIRLPCFIKMDVDGYEEEILAGASAVNSLRDVRWLIETHSAELERACEKDLRSRGFETRTVENAWWRLVMPELRPGAHNRWLVAWN